MKQLIVMGNEADYKNDFRGEIINYISDKREIINNPTIKISNMNPVFGDKFFGPKDCAILNQGDYYTLFSDISLLVELGYLVDDNSLTAMLLANKPYLFSMLHKYKIPTASFSKDIKPDVDNIINYGYQGDIRVTTSKNIDAINSYAPWHASQMKGYLIYTYLGKVITESKVVFTDIDTKNNDIWFNNLTYEETGCVTNLTEASIEPSRQALPKDMLKVVNDIPDIKSITWKDDLLKLLNAIPVTSVEITIGLVNDTTPVVVDIAQTHNPMSRLTIGKKRFYEACVNRFIEIMEK